MKKIKIGIFWSLFVGIQIVISIGLIYTLLTVPKTRTSGIEYNDDLELEATDPLVEKEDIFTQYFTPKYKYVNTSAADKDPPGCPDLAACVDLMIPLRTSFAVFFNSAVVIVSTTLSYSPNTAL